MIMALFKGRKARVAIPLTLGFILFNIILSFIIISFGMDSTTPYDPGTTGSSTLNINSTSDDDVSTTRASGWMSGFRNTLSGLPWWLNTIFIFIEVGVLGLCVYALIRGL